MCGPRPTYPHSYMYRCASMYVCICLQCCFVCFNDAAERHHEVLGIRGSYTPKHYLYKGALLRQRHDDNIYPYDWCLLTTNGLARRRTIYKWHHTHTSLSITSFLQHGREGALRRVENWVSYRQFLSQNGQGCMYLVWCIIKGYNN